MFFAPRRDTLCVRVCVCACVCVCVCVHVHAFCLTVLSLALLVELQPYPLLSNADVLAELQSGYRLHRPDECSEELYAVMLSCWKADEEV